MDKLPEPDRPLHPALADHAEASLADIMAVTRLKEWAIREAVRRGELAPPRNYGPRCARWPVDAVRVWLAARAQQAGPQARAAVTARAMHASEAAARKRQAAPA
jgi:hypothetical protein